MSLNFPTLQSSMFSLKNLMLMLPFLKRLHSSNLLFMTLYPFLLVYLRNCNKQGFFAFPVNYRVAIAVKLYQGSIGLKCNSLLLQFPGKSALFILCTCYHHTHFIGRVYSPFIIVHVAIKLSNLKFHACNPFLKCHCQG